MSSKFEVVVADFLTEWTVEEPILAPIARVTLAGASHERDLAPLLPTADALILYHDVASITDSSFSLAPRCRVIVRAGVGYNNVDLHAAEARGILVCNVPDYGSEEVADHAIMMLLAIARQLRDADNSIRAGRWDYTVALAAPRLRGKTLGIVGCGRIGTATALRAKAFGLNVVFHDPLVVPGTEKALGICRAWSLEELLEQSDFVSLHCYLDETTRHLMNSRTIALMRPGAILINTARGPVVEPTALLEALDTGHLLGAGLDVFEIEPLDNERLRQHPRVLLTPHSAFYSIEGFVELRRKTAEEVARVLRGEPPLNPVSLSAHGAGRMPRVLSNVPAPKS